MMPYTHCRRRAIATVTPRALQSAENRRSNLICGADPESVGCGMIAAASSPDESSEEQSGRSPTPAALLIPEPTSPQSKSPTVVSIVMRVAVITPTM
jgi:hypothetical protein